MEEKKDDVKFVSSTLIVAKKENETPKVAASTATVAAPAKAAPTVAAPVKAAPASTSPVKATPTLVVAPAKPTPTPAPVVA